MALMIVMSLKSGSKLETESIQPLPYHLEAGFANPDLPTWRMRANHHDALGQPPTFNHLSEQSL
jgi:hypothetical protein